MTGEVFALAVRPYLAVAFGLLGDYLISRGWLQPAQRQVWVDGWIQIISATGSVLLAAIVVYHEFRMLMQKTLQNQTTTVTTVKKDNNAPVETTTAVTTTIPSVQPDSLPEAPTSVPLWNQPVI